MGKHLADYTRDEKSARGKARNLIECEYCVLIIEYTKNGFPMLSSPPFKKDLTEDQVRVYNRSFQTKRLLVSGEPGTGKSTLLGLAIRDFIKETIANGDKPDVDLIAYNKNLVNFNGQLFQIPSETYYRKLNQITGFIDGVEGGVGNVSSQNG